MRDSNSVIIEYAREGMSGINNGTSVGATMLQMTLAIVEMESLTMVLSDKPNMARMTLEMESITRVSSYMLEMV